MRNVDGRKTEMARWAKVGRWIVITVPIFSNDRDEFVMRTGTD